MSRLSVFAAVIALSAVAACNSTSQKTAQPAPVQPEPVASVAPVAEPVAAKGTEPVAATVGEQKPEAVAKPIEGAAPTSSAAKPVAESKPQAPAVKPEIHVTQPVTAVSKEQAQVLGTKGNCFACHKLDAKVVGPAWKDIGAKYKSDAKAVATLATHIKAGGSFGWRMGNMPPRGGSTLSDAEVESLARFIAAMK